MKTDPKTYAYQAPFLYVSIFYSVISAWTLVSILFLVSKYERSGKADLTQLVIFAFIIGITWYFSLGLSYKVEVEEDGVVRLTSFRRMVQTHSLKISLIEGPLLPIGFIRFRLEREKIYLFCMAKDKALGQVLSFIQLKNPNIKFKSL